MDSSNSNLKCPVVILCGGQGTRLREETEYRPKPMVEIGGKPIIWHIMKGFSSSDLSDFVLCLGYKGQVIKDYFLNYESQNDLTISLGRTRIIEYQSHHEEQNFRVTLADTGVDTMTGARLRRVSNYVSGGTFIVTYGDGLADIDIQDLLAFHKSHGKIATVSCVKPYSRFGAIEFDEKGNIEQFREKPQLDGWISAGFFVFEPEIFGYLSKDENCVLEEQPLEKLAKDQQLMAYQHEGFFFAMDTYRDYLHLNKLWDNKEAPWAVWEKDRWKKVDKFSQATPGFGSIVQLT